MDLLAAMNTKVDMSDMAIVQPTEQSRAPPPESRGSKHMPLHHSRVRLPECSVSRVMATGEKKYSSWAREEEDQTSSGWGARVGELLMLIN